MTEITHAILEMIRTKTEARRAKIGVVLRGHTDIVDELGAQDHEVLAVSDRFSALWRVRRAALRRRQRPPFLAEANLHCLPFAPGSLNVLVIVGGLPRRPDPFELICRLRALLTPGGWLIAPHPAAEGARGAVEKIAALGHPKRRPPMERPEMCGLLLRAGFCDLAQETVSRRLTSWVVTAGRAGKFFDRQPEPVLFFFPDGQTTKRDRVEET